MNQSVLIPVNLIEANQYQPRVAFNHEELEELALSIKENGLIQPVVVRKKGNQYEIIAGERRYRACKKLGYNEVQCIVIDSTDVQSAQMALVENIQRENLSAIEEAKAYARIIEETKITQVELAKKMGKSQSAIANKIRLLILPEAVQEKVNDKTITERHARALLGVHEDHVEEVLDTIIKKKLNVSQSEIYIEARKEKTVQPKNKTQGYSKNIKIGMNTIEQAVIMCSKAGINAKLEIEENDSEVKMIIKFLKEGN